MPHGDNCTTYYQNGNVHYNGGLKCGYYNIKGRLFYPNNQLLYEGTFKDGAIMNNEAIIYAIDGSLKYKGKFPYY